MKNIAIRTKIMVGFSVLIIMTVGIGWFELQKLEENTTLTTEIAERDVNILHMLGDASWSLSHMTTLRLKATTDYLLRQNKMANDDPKRAQEEWHADRSKTESIFGEMEDAVRTYEAAAVSPQRKILWGKMLAQIKQLRADETELAVTVTSYFEMLNRGELTQAIALRDKITLLRKSADDRMEGVQALMREVTAEGTKVAASNFEQTRSTTLAVLTVCVIIGVAFSLMIQLSISRPLVTLMEFVGRIGQGDLTQRAVIDSTDELGTLGQALNQMVAGLQDATSQTRVATENLTTAAAEILASTNQQVASTSEQAAAVQQTTATIEEVSQSGSQIAEKSRQVATAAEATSAATTSGLHAVQIANQTMESIREQAEAVAENIVALSEKTQAVGEIIATVNDIAERSNLLALNAAIEAAAAGEAGRSFSVVASEMKSLAVQSKDATVQVRFILGEIQKGINTSVMLTEEAVKRVDSGKQQAIVTEQTIRQTADMTLESIQAFQQIVAATNQQQIGLEQVTQALKNIRIASEQSATSTRQLEKAAANLNALGQQLNKAVERYKV